MEEFREMPGGPRLAFVHLDDVPPQEVVAQVHEHEGRRASVHIRFLEWTSERMVAHTRYDPGLILERHGHASDHWFFVLEGELDVGGRRCPAGMLVVLERGAAFGPLVAGPEGCTFLECYAGGDVSPVPRDPAGYEQMLRELGITPLGVLPFERPNH